MTHPLIEELLAPGRSLSEAREEFATLYGLSDDQGLMEAAGDVASWLLDTADRPLSPLPLEVRKRMIEAAVALFHLNKRHRATLEWIEETRH